MRRDPFLLLGTGLLGLSFTTTAFSAELPRAAQLDNASAETGVGGVRSPASVNFGNVKCQKCVEDALKSFQANDYDVALKHVTDGLAQSPGNSDLLQFRALVLFANGDYHEASAVIHTVLAARPAWNWGKLSSFYPTVETYTTQLRSLEAFTRRNPGDGAARFLQAYHYLVGGFPDAATRELEMVVRLESNDNLAAVILRATRESSNLNTSRN